MPNNLDRNALMTPTGLLAALQGIFPDFGDGELAERILAEDATVHTVMFEFAGSFRAGSQSSSQLNRLASLLTLCITETDALENAVGTCFLEHLRQIDRERVFAKQMPNDLKAYIRSH